MRNMKVHFNITKKKISSTYKKVITTKEFGVVGVIQPALLGKNAQLFRNIH